MRRSRARARPAAAGPTASVSEAAAKVSPARAAAFKILMLVEAGKGHSDELLCETGDGALANHLGPEDHGLATALVMGVLRWQIALDARVRTLLARPEQRLAEPVELVLRLGAFQLLHLDRVPAHAVLYESVEMCRAAGHPHAAGMVNAVLRKLVTARSTSGSLDRTKLTPQKRDANELTSQNRDVGRPHPARPVQESTAEFAERLGHPLWLVERWVTEYGREAALTICEYGQQEPQAGALFANRRADWTEEAAAIGLVAEPATELATGLADDDLPQMDDGSRLVAELAATAMPRVAERRARVWDCCAAPGGKTLLLARRLGSHGRSGMEEDRGAAILATDVSAKRLAQMESRLRRYGYAQGVRCAVVDTSAAGEAVERKLRIAFGGLDGVLDAEFDLVLCDVPCSGTGTLARNPEIRHRLRVEELARQAARQRAILAGAARRLAPGGRLVYSTCSLEPEENQQVVDAVASEAGLRTVPVGPMIERLAASGVLKQEVAARLIGSAVSMGALRTLPGLHGCDGFFAAVLERASG